MVIATWMSIRIFKVLLILQYLTFSLVVELAYSASFDALPIKNSDCDNASIDAILDCPNYVDEMIGLNGGLPLEWFIKYKYQTKQCTKYRNLICRHFIDPDEQPIEVTELRSLSGDQTVCLPEISDCLDERERQYQRS